MLMQTVITQLEATSAPVEMASLEMENIAQVR